MAGRPLRRARLAEEARRRAAQARRPDHGMLALRVAGIIALGLLVTLWVTLMAAANATRWCGRTLAARLDLEDILDHLPRVR